MLRIRNKLGIGLFVAVLCAVVLLTGIRASESQLVGPPVDPIVGVWSAQIPSNTGPTLVTMTFNQGGTTIEYDTPGTNSFASPGESLVQGFWKKTGFNAYTFKEQNFIFNASGQLFLENISTCHLILSRDGNSFNASCNFAFLDCTPSLCPGDQIADFPGNIIATRFE